MSIKYAILAALMGALTGYIGTRLGLPTDVIVSCCALLIIAGQYSREERN